MATGLPDCGSTDTSISQVVIECDGVARTFTGFPDDPAQRTYTCTKFMEGGTTFMQIDGLAFSLVIDGADVDGVLDACDNCPKIFNPNQSDLDEDGIGDVCDDQPTAKRGGGFSCNFSPKRANAGMAGAGTLLLLWLMLGGIYIWGRRRW